jgi:hypothetical protein
MDFTFRTLVFPLPDKLFVGHLSYATCPVTQGRTVQQKKTTGRIPLRIMPLSWEGLTSRLDCVSLPGHQPNKLGVRYPVPALGVNACLSGAQIILDCRRSSGFVSALTLAFAFGNGSTSNDPPNLTSLL